MKRTYYQILNVDPKAPIEVLTAVHKALMRVHHPDNGSKPDAAKAAEINAAFDVLKDPAKREKYDAELAKQRKPKAAPAPVVQPIGTNEAVVEVGMLLFDRFVGRLDGDLKQALRQAAKGVRA